MTAEEYFRELNLAIQVPCFVASFDTNIIIYCNSAFESIFQRKDGIIGECYDDIVEKTQFNVPDLFEYEQEESGIYHRDLYVSSAGIEYDISIMKVEFDGTEYNLVKYRDKNIDFCSEMSFEEAMMQCFAILNRPKGEILISTMELLTQYYQCERAYVYRVNAQKSTIRCAVQWSVDPDFVVAEEVDRAVGEYNNLNGSILIDWAKEKQDHGLIFLQEKKDDQDRDAVEAGILHTFKMRNSVFGLLLDEDKEMIGIIGFSNFDEKKLDLRFFHAAILFVSQFLKQENQSFTTLLEIDPLTEVYSRSVYSKHLEEMKLNPPKTIGIISANVNGLKYINENSGIAEGDKRIKNTANRLKEHFDVNFYRLSGDEFVGVALDTNETEFEEKVVALHSAMKHEGKFEFAIGHAWEKGECDINLMLHEAETLMFINKQEYYHQSQQNFVTVNHKLLTNLLSYLENDEFMIYLQPQVRLLDGSLYGAEALIRRFDKKNQKMVFPDQFIALYEKNSVIRHVDIFVLETVCKLISKWREVGIELPISVNLSRVTLQEYDIVDTIVETCKKYSVPHRLVVIEVTERVGLIENNVASELIKNFKDHGFNISLDDFGCAYSNIVTLAQIEVDEVKIDKSLVDDLTTSRKNHILVKNMLSMCHELEGASTLAEGIEDEHQARILHELGCHLGQGYFYSRPLPVEVFEEKYLN